MENQYPHQPGAQLDPNSGAQAPSAYEAAYGTTPQPQHSAPAGTPPYQPTVEATPQHANPSSQVAYQAPVVEVAKKGASGGKTFLVAFLGALLACALAFGVFGVVQMNQPSSSSSVSLGAAESGSVEAAETEASLAEAVADKCLPSVASITVYSKAQSQGNGFYDLLYGYGYGNQGDQGTEAESGLGSGVVISEDGYVITNNHVVADGTRFEVVIEGKTYEADLVGQDESSDVAVIKVKDASGLKAIQIADSDNIKIGEWVMSIGSPFGLEQSVATGIVSATSRSQIVDASTDMYGMSSGTPTIYPNMIQTDAAINPGNSGGALVDANGQLIGINTLITSYSGNYSGVGFAIPSNYAIKIAQEIIEGKEPTHAFLGVNLTTVDPTTAQRYGFPVSEGAYVSSVTPDSGAAKAGIEQGDIITEFDGVKITSASDLTLQVRTKNEGDTVPVVLNRDGEVKTVDVTLGSSK